MPTVIETRTDQTIACPWLSTVPEVIRKQFTQFETQGLRLPVIHTEHQEPWNEYLFRPDTPFPWMAVAGEASDVRINGDVVTAKIELWDTESGHASVERLKIDPTALRLVAVVYEGELTFLQVTVKHEN